ncbi:leucyl/phenylalanyl-tRNA--protein transferase [Planktosalinus lacus]|uniref:Leucyl/phenylalanyl-tRNA--protein transferase n=1 Tax=Planktosalinus lacus TaxID=1526573 RepID=A0A8J2VBN1_9FLAO|nr:leucyl/phenylalanyl-tRNA--protein transferase [Planktosalinus lacus]GGD95895.1 leucyl/phenylalanyl-tRNA--protein transferase [Planktosalinus lacus]
MIFLKDNSSFPDVSLADEEGLLAIGGKLRTKRLLEAYNSGVFPWYSEGQPVLWWSPDPRMVLYLDKLKVSKSLNKTIRSRCFNVTFNTAFTEVIQQCSITYRKDQNGTWITQEMIDAYTKLHSKGYALSVEVWQNEELVGGLYGIDLPEKKVFCGESMFHKVSDASKVALVHLVEHLNLKNYKLIDCQVHTKHLESLGACLIPRDEFLKYIK